MRNFQLFGLSKHGQDAHVTLSVVLRLERPMKKTIAALMIVASETIAFAVPIPQPAQRTGPGLSDTQDFINQSMRQAVAGREEDPLKFISKDMLAIVGDLDKYQTDKPVQVKQEKVISELDILIEKLQKACKSG